VHVQTGDKCTVVVQRNVHNQNVAQNAYDVGKFVCLTGTVQGDLTVKEMQAECFGDAFDLAAFSAVIRARSAYPQVFS
jgi:hypothetical protein